MQVANKLSFERMPICPQNLTPWRVNINSISVDTFVLGRQISWLALLDSLGHPKTLGFRVTEPKRKAETGKGQGHGDRPEAGNQGCSMDLEI